MPSHRQPIVVGLGGTLRDYSYSRAALKTALRIAETHGACPELLDLRELDLPMFRPGAALDDYAPEQRASIARLLDSARRADALIWSSPTYHGTVTGVFKNALDFLDLMDRDHPPYLQRRVVGLITLTEQQTILTMLSAAYELRAWVAPTQVVMHLHDDFDEHLNVKDGKSMRRLTRMVNEIIEFMERKR